MGVHLGGKNRNTNSFKRLDINEQNVGVCKSPNPYISKKIMELFLSIFKKELALFSCLKLDKYLNTFTNRVIIILPNIQYKTVLGKLHHFLLPLHQPHFKGWCSSVKPLQHWQWRGRVRDGFSLCYSRKLNLTG